MLECNGNGKMDTSPVWGYDGKHYRGHFSKAVNKISQKCNIFAAWKWWKVIFYFIFWIKIGLRIYDRARAEMWDGILRVFRQDYHSNYTWNVLNMLIEIEYPAEKPPFRSHYLVDTFLMRTLNVCQRMWHFPRQTFSNISGTFELDLIERYTHT